MNSATQNDVNTCTLCDGHGNMPSPHYIPGDDGTEETETCYICDGTGNDPFVKIIPGPSEYDVAKSMNATHMTTK